MRLWGIVRRTDLLLVALVLLLSAVLYLRLAPPSEEAKEIQAPGQDTQVVDDKSAGGERDAPSYAAVPVGSPVRFLMFNVQNYFVEKDVPRTSNKRRFKSVKDREALADAIASVRPEIVGLVEIGGKAALEDLASRLHERGLDYPYYRVLERWGEDRALAILSQHPIVKDQSVPDCLLGESSGRHMLRGILDITLKVEKDGRMFRIMGVHLKSRVADDQRAAEYLRNREAKALANHLRHAMLQEPEMPVLVYGDWNAGPAETPLQTISQGTRATGPMRRITPVDSRKESWTIVYSTNSEYNTFDHICVNRVLSARMGRKSAMGIVDNETARHASDHRALWCDIR